MQDVPVQGYVLGRIKETTNQGYEMLKKARYYQTECLDALRQYLRDNPEKNPLVELPTGAGKSFVIAEIAKGANKRGSRVLMLTDKKELVQQNHDAMLENGLTDVGIYSSGIGKRQRYNGVVCAGIQSVYKKPDMLGQFSIIIIDEAHKMGRAADTMYGQFLARHGCRVIGFTATPYRLGEGLLTAEGSMWDDICYRISVKELIDNKYLCTLVSAETGICYDTSSLKINNGEFVQKSLFDLIEKRDDITQQACADIIEKTADRDSVLIFGADIKHCERIKELLGPEAHILASTKKYNAHRDVLIQAFKSKHIKYLINCNILTTGFNAPNTDCIAMLRPTASTGLYVQIVGRGARLAEGKTDCLVLDYGGNIERHGPVDDPKTPKPRKKRGENDAERNPGKECPACEVTVPSTAKKCPDCGFEFPATENITNLASAAPVLSTQSARYLVKEVRYQAHWSRAGNMCLKVTYLCERLRKHIHEYVMVGADGYQGASANKWLAAFANGITIASIHDVIDNKDKLRKPITISVKNVGSKWPEITAYEFKQGDE